MLPSPRVMKRGVQAFILFSTAGTLLGMWWKRPAGIGEVLSHLDIRFAALLIPLVGLDFWLGGLRYRLFFDGRTMPYVSLRECMRSNWANMFMGAVTPFQTGGAPAQLYVLWRRGVPLADSLLVSTVNLVATLVFFLVSSLLAICWIPPNLFGGDFSQVFHTGFTVVSCIAGALLLFLFFPKRAHALLDKLLGFLPGKTEAALNRRRAFLDRADEELQRFQRGFRSIVSHNKRGIALTVIATQVLFFNKYLMGYVIARSIGQEVPFESFIGLQIIQLLLIYFAPTPGASGVAELSSVWLMGKLMPGQLLLIYAVLWRLVTTVFGALIGGMVLLHEFREAESE